MGTWRAWVGLALVVRLWAASGAGAADWSLVPSVTPRSEFNSNVNFALHQPVSDYIFTVQPMADFNYRTEISQLQGHVGLLGQHYLTQSQLDHIDQNYQINGRYQAADRVNLSITSAYISDTTMIEELLASGVVIGRTPRQSFAVGPGIGYKLSELLSATVNYNFSRVVYQAPQYVDYSSHQGSLNLTYLWGNEKTALVSNSIVRETLYAGGNHFRSLGLYGGVTHKFSERWDINLRSGVNISSFNYHTQVLDFSQFPYFIPIKTKQIEASNLTPYVNISTNYRWTNLTLNASFTRDQAPSAYGAIYEYNRLFLAWAYDFTERLKANLTGAYSLSTQSGQTFNSSYNYYSINSSLAYRLTERMSVSPGYSYSGRENLTGGTGSAHVHVAWLQVSYTYPAPDQK
jgi:hypothetical protein